MRVVTTIERVKELGNERKISLFKLSVLCDVPYPTLKTAETRNTQLSVDTIERICNGLEITMADFFQDWND